MFYMTESMYHTGKLTIMVSNFCVVAGILHSMIMNGSKRGGGIGQTSKNLSDQEKEDYFKFQG